MSSNDYNSIALLVSVCTVNKITHELHLLYNMNYMERYGVECAVEYLSWSGCWYGLWVNPVLTGLFQLFKGSIHHLSDLLQTVHTHG